MPRENSARMRSKTLAFRRTPEEHKLICELAAWSGMSRQDYIITKLTDTQAEVRPSVSVQKALKGSMAELAKEAHLTASYGELSESLQQGIELIMGFFLALGEPVDVSTKEVLQKKTSPDAVEVSEASVDDDVSIFGMGCG